MSLWRLALLPASLAGMLPIGAVMLPLITDAPGPLVRLAENEGVMVLDEPLNLWIGLGTLLVLSGVFIVSKYGVK